MATDQPTNRWRADGEFPQALPLGVKLVRTLKGHHRPVTGIDFSRQGETLASGSGEVTVKLWDAKSGTLLSTAKNRDCSTYRVAFSPDGETLAGAGSDGTISLWEVRSGKLLRSLQGRHKTALSLAFDPRGETLATGSAGNNVSLWAMRTGKLAHTFEGHNGYVMSVAFDPHGETLASGSVDHTAKLWDISSGKLVHTLNNSGAVSSVTFSPRVGMLAVASADHTIKLWEPRTGKLLRTLEGHTGEVNAVVFSQDGRLLISKSRDHTIRLWHCETWETVAILPTPTNSAWWAPALALHPTLPLLAAANSAPDTPEEQRARDIHIWELDYDLLMGQRSEAVHHTTGKIVLLGDHSVGKSALGYRLIHGQFEKQESTHGQQFWVFPSLGNRRTDGTLCEAILWDFAGQPDYRMVHALFVDDADLALVLFDASDIYDPLHGVGFWLKQLQREQRHCPIILVAAQTDRGTASLTTEELEAFCRKHDIIGPVTTSALTGEGLEELVERMKVLIAWEEKPATVTTTTFKKIKDYVLALKGAKDDSQVIVTPEEMRVRLQTLAPGWQFADAEIRTAVGHLENYGYVKRLKTSKGELRILLQPERLNNLASSFVLEARRNPKGLGALEERLLLAGRYNFPELSGLVAEDRDVLLDSSALLFLEHNVCFRETDPLRKEQYLVFPELINLKKPAYEDVIMEDGAAYTVTGPTENVFASLVVLLGYTHTFTRTLQWQNNARYEIGDGLVCGFRQEAERDGEVDFVLCFSPHVGTPVRTLFQGLFESFLARRNLTVMRYDPVRCRNGHLLNRAVVREAMDDGGGSRFCPQCGKKVTLPKRAESIQLTRNEQAEVDSQRQVAEQRTRFEQAVFRIRAYTAEQNIQPPECFISYAWGEPQQERWVEKRLAADLQKAGIVVVLDRWDNAQIGMSVNRFIERLEKIDRIVIVGTPLYRDKYDNKDARTGYVVESEVDLINTRLIRGGTRDRTVLPLLLAGEKETSLPPLLHGRVHADFRNEARYFLSAFDLILSLYRLPPSHAAVADLRESLR